MAYGKLVGERGDPIEGYYRARCVGLHQLFGPLHGSKDFLYIYIYIIVWTSEWLTLRTALKMTIEGHLGFRVASDKNVWRKYGWPYIITL